MKSTFDQIIYIIIFILIFIIILIPACAKVNAPTGGPRDRTPPVVVESQPENGARNFKGNRIEITFNEFVVLEKINDKFMISPPLKEKPEVFIRGKSVIVEFDEKELRDSTTYTFNFQDAIRDLNESNIYDNYQFVFSTGKVIDSLTVAGQVYNSFTLEVPENTSVLLYSNLADSAVKKSIPAYISRIDQTGSFRINNIRPGRYRLYALKDIDNSKNYNLNNEEFAFIDSVITVTAEKNYLPVPKDTVKAVKGKVLPGRVLQRDTAVIRRPAPADTSGVTPGSTLILFKAAETNYYLTSSDRKVAYRMVFSLSVPPGNMDFRFRTPDADEDAYFIERSRNRDTLNVWITDSSLFSQQQIDAILNYPFTDTTGKVTVTEDTIQMRFMAPKLPRQKVKKSPLQITNSVRGGVLKPGQNIVFTSPTPLLRPDTSLIRLYETTADKKQIKIPYNLTGDSSSSMKFVLYAKMPEGRNYLFISDSAAFRNIYGETSDSTGIRFSIPKSTDFGKIIMTINEVDGPMIIQLLDKEEKVIAERFLTSSGKVIFPLLDKGNYRMRAIFDTNGDGRWTTGDFSKRLQPEAVAYYKDEIPVTVDWEVENNWALGAKNFKNPRLRNVKKR